MLSTDRDVVNVLRQLIAIPSVNPMGAAAGGEHLLEYRLTDWLEAHFAAAGFVTHRQTVAPGRDNFYARIDGRPSLAEGGALVALEVHQDTVPIDGMTVPPFQATQSSGRVYGRGACDVKGGMACFLSTIAQLQHAQLAAIPTILLACSVNEEYGFTGAHAMADAWANNRLPILPRVPDAVVVAEPTELNVVVTHKGVVRWKCRSHGRAGHSSRPQDGENAIYRMAQALRQLEQHATHLLATTPHPVLGTPTLSVGTIHGGLSVNTIPDECTVEIDRRLLPDEDPEAARRQAITWLAENCSCADSLEHAPAFLAAGGLSDTGNGPLANLLSTSARQCGHAGEQVGVAYATDAPMFARIGIPTVVFGPGSARQAHTADEWVEVAQLESAVEILYHFLAGFADAAQ